jgi:hypothetical protein
MQKAEARTAAVITGRSQDVAGFTPAFSKLELAAKPSEAKMTTGSSAIISSLYCRREVYSILGEHIPLTQMR